MKRAETALLKAGSQGGERRWIGGHWRRNDRKPAELAPLARRLLRACLRRGMTVREAENLLRLVALEFK